MRIFKILSVAALFLFLIIHTSFTLLYVLPENLVPFSLKEKSKKYIAPLFDQGWGLFAPVPEVNKKVYVSYFKNNKWSGWEAPFNKYLYAHQSNRVSANAKIVLSTSSILHYLYNENAEQLEEKKNISGNISSGYFKVLKHEVVQELTNKSGSPKKIKLLVVYSKANCNSNQMYSIYYPEFEIAK